MIGAFKDNLENDCRYMTSNLQFYESIASTYGEQWTIEEENRIAAGRLISPGEMVLEIACGNGLFLIECRASAVGVDFSTRMADIAAGRTGAMIVQADGAALPFRPGVFDTVVIVNTLHNQIAPEEWLRAVVMLDPGRVLMDFRNALNPVVAYRRWRFRKSMTRIGVEYRNYFPWLIGGLLKKGGLRAPRRFRVIRPLSDPRWGFRWRNVVSAALSCLPWLAPLYIVEAVRCD